LANGLSLREQAEAAGVWCLAEYFARKARAHRDAVRKLLAADVDSLGMMTQARSQWPRLQRPVNARNQRSGFALICTPGKLALQDETNIEVDNDGGERNRGFTSQKGSGTSNSSILSIAHPSSSRHVLGRNNHRHEFRKST
jgi:hypothetical protein